MNSQYPVGKCEQMCPEAEILLEKEGLLHVLEKIPNIKGSHKADRNRVVKEFSRSAAGRTSQNVKDLRTVDAILLTVNYLMHDVVTADYVPWNIIYDFVMDRLRAVRQDIVIQSFQRPDTICIFQPIVSFYAYSAYRLCEEPIEIFDPVLNKNHLLECLKRLLCLYDDSDILISKFKNSEKLMKNVVHADTRPSMESLYLILNLGNTVAMERALQLPKIWRTPLVCECLRISMEYWKGNYVGVCKAIAHLPALLLLSAVLHLPAIRRKCLRTMSSAYSCKNVVFPAEQLAKWLLYNDVNELLSECWYYGIPVEGKKIVFTKTCFGAQKPEMPPKHLKFVDKILSDISLPDLLLHAD